MSAPDHSTREAIVFELIAGLALYEEDVRLLCSGWLDMDQYQLVSQEVDDLRLIAGALPWLSMPWGALLASHAELIHGLWKAGKTHGGDEESVARLLEDHIAAIRSMGAAARRLNG